MNHDTPSFEQRPDSSEAWGHPVIGRVATVLKDAASEELSFAENVGSYGSPEEETEHIVSLATNDMTVASAWQITGDDLVVSGFSFDFCRR